MQEHAYPGNGIIDAGGQRRKWLLLFELGDVVQDLLIADGLVIVVS